ncbi:MAG: NUDIX hydrolase [Dehalococcoidia bacterium]|nr:MAG: NUDIX hydrolase [Dehalococcoidia bacterium]
MFEGRSGAVADGVLEVARTSGPAEVEYQNPWQRVLRVPLTVQGRPRDLYVTDYGDRAAVVVVRDGAVLMVRQYRYLIDRISWEIPGGRVDAGETPAAGAARECAEETGVRCRTMEPLISFHPGLDTLHNPTTLFTCSDSTGDPAAGHEALDVTWVPLGRALAWIWDGTVVDSLSILGLLAHESRSRQ